MESSIDRPQSQIPPESNAASSDFSAPDSNDTSSGDSIRRKRYTDGDLTDINRTTGLDEVTPPCDHRVVCDMWLICPCCKKEYCSVHQSEYFTRHKLRCQDVLTSSSTGESESGTKCIIIIIHWYRWGGRGTLLFYDRTMFDLKGVPLLFWILLKYNQYFHDNNMMFTTMKTGLPDVPHCPGSPGKCILLL